MEPLRNQRRPAAASDPTRTSSLVLCPWSLVRFADGGSGPGTTGLLQRTRDKGQGTTEIRPIRCGGRPGPSCQKGQPSTQAILRSHFRLKSAYLIGCVAKRYSLHWCPHASIVMQAVCSVANQWQRSHPGRPPARLADSLRSGSPVMTEVTRILAAVEEGDPRRRAASSLGL